MTMLFKCDGCEGMFESVVQRYSVDYIEASYGPMTDRTSAEGEDYVEVKVFATESEFHLCGAECLAAWAFRRKIDGTESP